MSGRFGKYGDIKRKARVRPNRPLRKKLENPKRIERRKRRSTKKTAPA